MVHRGETNEEDEKKESAAARKPFLRPLQSSPHHSCAATAAAVAAITHGPSTSASSRPTQCSTARPPRKMKTGAPPPIVLRPATL